MDGSSGRRDAAPSLRDVRLSATGGLIGALALTVALTALVSTAPAAAAAPQVQVSGGTLSITSADDQPVSALAASDAPFLGPGYPPPVSDVFGPPPGFSTPSDWFAYGPRFLWHGTAPAPGTGCHAQPGGPGEQDHVECPGPVYQIDIALAGGDDYLSVASGNAPVRVSGGAGDDGLRIDAHAAATLDGGPGNDSLRLEGAGTANGGPGDDYISVHTPGVVADCGEGDDDVVDDLYYLSGPATVDEATCGPVLRPVPPKGLPTPPQPGEFRAIARIKPRNGRVKLSAFRPSEAGLGTIQLKQARAVTKDGYPRPGTKWTACSKRRRFHMRAGRVLRTALKLVPRVARRANGLRPPRGRFSRKSMIPCSLHVSGVDDDGERFHRKDFSLVLIHPR
jgi:hypothetical protein